jgi:ATP/maltotriose-dependent transcriptional regulator MalT
MPLYLITATHSDLPLPLARLCALLDILELRMADLHFTNQEVVDIIKIHH